MCDLLLVLSWINSLAIFFLQLSFRVPILALLPFPFVQYPTTLIPSKPYHGRIWIAGFLLLTLLHLNILNFFYARLILGNSPIIFHSVSIFIYLSIIFGIWISSMIFEIHGPVILRWTAFYEASLVDICVVYLCNWWAAICFCFLFERKKNKKNWTFGCNFWRYIPKSG